MQKAREHQRTIREHLERAQKARSSQPRPPAGLNPDLLKRIEHRLMDFDKRLQAIERERAQRHR